MNLQNYCRKNDAEIQRRIDRGIWRPSLDTGHVYSTVKRGYLCEIERNGYKTVTDHYQTFRVSRIIWIAANGIPAANLEVDHINGIRSDNRLENLQLVTSAENKMRCSAALTFADAEEMRRLFKGGMNKQKLADHFGVSRTTVQHIIKNRRYKSKPPHEINAIRAREEISRIGACAVSEIQAEAAGGRSVLQISRRWNISRAAVLAILRGEA